MPPLREVSSRHRVEILVAQMSRDDRHRDGKRPRGLADIGVGADDTVWGVNSSGGIYRYSGSGTWKNIPGGLSGISAGSITNVWGVNSSGGIYTYTGDDANPWVQIPGGLSDIGAAADGTVWGVNSAGNIYRYSS